MKSFVILLFVVFVFSCASKSDFDSLEVAAVDVDPSEQLNSSPVADIYSSGRTRLIKTVNYRFEVNSVKQSGEAIEVAIKKYPAYISSSDMRLDNPILENKMTIRVQSEYFNDLLKDIDLQASFVNYRDVKTEDVAKQFVDLESRLRTKREVETRYTEILRNKTGSIEDLLKAEKKIGELHEEIEATVSRLNYLKDEVAYSTINLEFYQTITQQISSANKIPLTQQFGKALHSGWTMVISFALALTYIWPFIILSAVVIYLFRFLQAKKQSRHPIQS